MTRKPYLSHERTRHGKLVWYFKRNGKRKRLPDVYGTEEFNTAYEAALNGNHTQATKKKTDPRSLAWLVSRYKESTSFSLLSRATRSSRENIMAKAVDLSGDKPFASITRKHIFSAMEKRTTVNSANHFLEAMRAMFKWAVQADLLETDPTEGIKKTRVKTDGHHTWTLDEVRQYREFYKIGTMPRLAIDLLLYLGLRRSDVVKICHSHINEGAISVATQKTGAYVHLPVSSTLMASIDAVPRAGEALLSPAKGRPFPSPEAFGSWFRRRCREAKIPKRCSPHGLRKAGATIAAEEGASAHEIMAMYGWSNLAMAEIYTRKASKIKLAKAASDRIAKKI